MSDTLEPDDGSVSSAVSRRHFVGGAAAVAGVAGIASVPLLNAPAASAADSSIDQAFNALAAFVVPGNDEYSRRQGVFTGRRGGVANGGGKVVQNVLNAGLPIVIAELSISAPGALGFSLILRYYTFQEHAGSAFGPFGHPFANLKWKQKRDVLDAIDTSGVFKDTPITYSANSLATLAALGGFSEGTSLVVRQGQVNTVSGTPVGHELSKYQGVSDGHPEFIGYYQDRTEVTG